MKLLAWILLTPFLIAGAGISWLVLSADWAGPDYVAVPAKMGEAFVKHEMGTWRASRVETTRIQLQYSYSWGGFVYKGWRFSCEPFGGNEIMPSLRDDALDTQLQSHVQEIQRASQVFVWVDSKQPGDACLYKDGQFASQ